MLTNRRDVRIVWGDCDPAGIVFYPRYFEMFDTSTTALFERALGMTKFQFVKAYNSVGYPMVDTRARFLLPTRYGDDVVIETTVTEIRRSSFDMWSAIPPTRTRSRPSRCRPTWWRSSRAYEQRRPGASLIGTPPPPPRRASLDSAQNVGKRSGASGALVPEWDGRLGIPVASHGMFREA